MIGMFSPELEKLIEFTLADGKLTDQERALLETAAKKEGVDMNQLEVYIQYRLYQRKEEEIKQAEARKHNEPIGKVKRCPKCFELLEDQYRFCPKCQTPVADDSTADTAVNLGNANAICGGVNINRSKNITSCDTHYHSTTIHERSKSDAELKLDAVNQLRLKAEELIGERGRIDSIALTMLKPLASQLGIDDETFKTTIKEVRSNRSGCTSGLSSINARYLSQAQQAVQTNDIESLSGLFPRLEAIAAISQDDNVQYLYYLALSLLYPAKCIEVYEQQTDENYWRTFWAIITYIKVSNWLVATRELANLQPSLFEKPEEDLNVLEALFNLVKKDKDCAQDFLDDILGETSPQVAPFLRALEIALYEEECESPEVRFYSEQVIAKICSADEARREEEEVRARAESLKFSSLADDYYFGRNGKSKDYEKAVEYYRKAAEQGLAEAQYRLGECYAEGLGVEESEHEAAKWYSKAAEAGHAEAQYDLGECYYWGVGVEESAQEAVKWYRKAAEQGLARAQSDLGDCYEKGKGVEQSAQEAVKWYRKAAEQGDANGQYSLGECYEKGEGVEQSAQEAVKWYSKAAEQGDDEAIERLKNLKAKEEEAKRKAEEEARKKAEEEAAAEAKRKAAEEEAKRKAEEEARKKAEEEAAAEAKRKAAEAEHTEFDVILKSAGAATLGVVKAVKESTGLSLKESKEIVAKAPVVVMKNVSKTEAEVLKAALEEAGAEVEIKGPKELLDLLEICLTDGIITEKERKVLIKKATALGVDPHEFDLYIDAQVQKLQNAEAEVAKQTEPYITIDKLWVETDGVGLLYFHCDWTAYNLKSESIQMRLNMAAKSGKKIKRDASLNEYYFLNDKLAIKKDVQKFKNTILRLDHYELKMTHNEEKNLEFTLEFVNDATGESYHISKKMYISVWIYLNIFSSNKFEIRSQKIEL